MESWYWHKENESNHRGPVTESELIELYSSGKLNLMDRVWKEGLIDWMEVSDISFIRSIPPPINKPKSLLNPSDDNKISDFGGSKTPITSKLYTNKINMGKIVGYFIIVIGLILYISSVLVSGVYQVRGVDDFAFFLGFSVPFVFIILIGWAVLLGGKTKDIQSLPDKEHDL